MRTFILMTEMFCFNHVNESLSNKKQYVSYTSCKSQLKDIVCSVSQGSILGPLLFILYVNDITSASNVLDFILFADDTTILYSHENIESQVSV